VGALPSQQSLLRAAAASRDMWGGGANVCAAPSLTACLLVCCCSRRCRRAARAAFEEQVGEGHSRARVKRKHTLSASLVASEAWRASLSKRRIWV
jgi:hypothetical protein